MQCTITLQVTTISLLILFQWPLSQSSESDDRFGDLKSLVDGGAVDRWCRWRGRWNRELMGKAGREAACEMVFVRNSWPFLFFALKKEIRQSSETTYLLSWTITFFFLSGLHVPYQKQFWGTLADLYRTSFLLLWICSHYTGAVQGVFSLHTSPTHPEIGTCEKEYYMYF